MYLFSARGMWLDSLQHLVLGLIGIPQRTGRKMLQLHRDITPLSLQHRFHV